jgi:hypothetical protein
MDFNFELPHIKYLINSEECQVCVKIHLKEDSPNFKYGEAYLLQEVLYAETKEDKREKILIFKDKSKIHVDVNDFGDESDLRELKIKKILDEE